MADPFRRLSTDIRRIVSAGLRNSESLESILIRVREVFDAIAVSDAQKEELLLTATQQFSWIAERTISPQSQQDLLEILATSGSAFATIGGDIDAEIVREISRGIREGLPASELENIIAHRVAGVRHKARTIGNTALLAFTRADRFRKADVAGVQKFKYVGPSPERAICREWYKRTFTLSEINQLDNKQISPVRLYCGGYNCRHQWIPVID